jgi:hypothetical protein
MKSDHRRSYNVSLATENREGQSPGNAFGHRSDASGLMLAVTLCGVDTDRPRRRSFHAGLA